MAFPISPSNDDLHTEFGRTFKYSSATNSWSSATPDAPEDNTPITQGYVDAQSLPLTGVAAGSKAFVQDGNKLFIFTGSGWFEIATINTAPTITVGAQASYALDFGGTPTVITLQATDPEGIPLVWTHEITSGSLGDATVSNTDNVFTITPGAQEVAFNITFTASDGINTDTSVSSFTLEFPPPIHIVGWGNEGSSGQFSFDHGRWPRGLFFNQTDLNGTSLINAYDFPSAGTLNIRYQNASTSEVYLTTQFKYYSFSGAPIGNALRFYGTTEFESFNPAYIPSLNKSAYMTALTGPSTRVVIEGVTNTWDGNPPRYAYHGSSYGFCSAGANATLAVQNTIDKFSFASNNNAVSHGTLTTAGFRGHSYSSDVAGYLAGIGYPQNATNQRQINKFPFASATGSTITAGVLLPNTGGIGGSGFTTYDYGYGSGGNKSPKNTPTTTPLQRFSFASETDATLAGYMTMGADDNSRAPEGITSYTHGYVAGYEGSAPYDSFVLQVRKFAFSANVTIANTATLANSRNGATALSSAAYGYVVGSTNPSNPAVVRSSYESFPFASDTVMTPSYFNGTLGNFNGSNSKLSGSHAGINSNDDGYLAGGLENTGTYSNTIQKISWSMGSNSVDVGNLVGIKAYSAGHQV